MKTELKREKRLKRHKRIKVKIFGTAKVPRLSVFRSRNHIYVQLIDDEKGKTLLAVGDLKTKKAPKEKSSLSALAQAKKVERSKEVGRLVAKKALKIKIEKVIFDRGGYKYHGRVKAVAEGAREGGLKF